jgi:phytoene dehydrogenase-like protein
VTAWIKWWPELRILTNSRVTPKKIDWALDGPIPWTDPAVLTAATVHLGGTLDEAAASERAVWRGEHPEEPFVLLVQQSQFDDTRAPEGKHTGYAYCHAPAGSTVDLTANVERQVERFAPGFREMVDSDLSVSAIGRRLRIRRVRRER